MDQKRIVGQRKPGTFEPGDKRAGRPKGVRNKATVEVKEFVGRFLDDKPYQENLLLRLRAGEAPHMETLFWHYRYGKPVDRVEMTGKDGAALFPDTDAGALAALASVGLRESEEPPPSDE